jgi:hypothetical protein
MKSRILLVTLLAALALFLATWAPASPSQAGETDPAGAPSQAEEALAALLPDDGAVRGWKKAGPPTFYGRENLWDCINGAAALYLDYGFSLVVTAEYTTGDGSTTAAMEIYQMETPLHAFAIYAAERSHQYTFIKIGVEGYLGRNVLNFWKGPYYTKVTSYRRADEGAGETLRNLAAAVAESIPGQYAEPEAFGYFPQKNRVPRSERYIPKDFLGYPFFRSGYRVDYQDEGSRYQLFLVPNPSPRQAKEAFASYREHLASQDPDVSLETRADYQDLAAPGRQTAFQHGSFVGGVLGTTAGDLARKGAEEMLTNLKAAIRPSSPDSPGTPAAGSGRGPH